MFMSLQNLYVGILTCMVMVLGSGALGKRLGHEDIAHLRGISTLRKEVPERSVTPSHEVVVKKHLSRKWVLARH